MSLNIRIYTVDHKSQRYDTCGDWRWSSTGNLNITVSNLGDWRKELCIGIHELVEAFLCRERNITQNEIDKFDITFENNRREGNTDEPGDDIFAPYRKEHFFATNIERAIAHELGLDWKEYEETINSL